MKSATLGLAACLAVGLAGGALAQDLKATQKYTDTGIGFDLEGGYTNFTLTISGPNGMHASTSSKAGVPSINLKELGATEDGAYKYQLTASGEEKVQSRSKLDNGRAGGPEGATPQSVSKSGRFDVKGGAIVKVDLNAKPGKSDR